MAGCVIEIDDGHSHPGSLIEKTYGDVASIVAAGFTSAAHAPLRCRWVRRAPHRSQRILRKELRAPPLRVSNPLLRGSKDLYCGALGHDPALTSSSAALKHAPAFSA
jgi:hypothetical protein